MKFICNLCEKPMDYLNTPGDEINDNLMCPSCADRIRDALKKTKQKILDAFGSFPDFN